MNILVIIIGNDLFPGWMLSSKSWLKCFSRKKEKITYASGFKLDEVFVKFKFY